MRPQAYFTHSNTEPIQLSKQCSPSLWTLKWLATSDNTLENRINSRGEVAIQCRTKPAEWKRAQSCAGMRRRQRVKCCVNGAVKR